MGGGRRGPRPAMDFAALNTKKGLTLVGQFACSMLAFSCMVNVGADVSARKFFVGIGVLVWLISMGLMALYVMGNSVGLPTLQLRVPVLRRVLLLHRCGLPVWGHARGRADWCL